MYFLADQVAEYDSARLRLGRVAQLLFVSDEKSAIQWLRQQLDPILNGENRKLFLICNPSLCAGAISQNMSKCLNSA